MYSLHVGVKPKNLKVVIQKLRKKGFAYHIDGDGWESWGEAPGTDVNDKNTLHINIVVEEYDDYRVQALRLVNHLRPQLVVAKTYVGPNYRAVLTDFSDWGSLNGREGCVPSFM